MSVSQLWEVNPPATRGAFAEAVWAASRALEQESVTLSIEKLPSGRLAMEAVGFTSQSESNAAWARPREPGEERILVLSAHNHGDEADLVTSVGIDTAFGDNRWLLEAAADFAQETVDRLSARPRVPRLGLAVERLVAAAGSLDHAFIKVVSVGSLAHLQGGIPGTEHEVALQLKFDPLLTVSIDSDVLDNALHMERLTRIRSECEGPVDSSPREG